jgi:hypothetical protein
MYEAIGDKNIAWAHLSLAHDIDRLKLGEGFEKTVATSSKQKKDLLKIYNKNYWKMKPIGKLTKWMQPLLACHNLTRTLSLSQFNPNLSQLNPNPSQLNPHLLQFNPNLSQLNLNLLQLNPIFTPANGPQARNQNCQCL